MTLDAMDAVVVVRMALQLARFRYGCEEELQLGICEVLAASEIPYEREVVLGPRDRLDFLAEGGVCIEVKVHGGLSALTQQLFRHAASERVRGFVVVTSRAAHRGLPSEILGKPVGVVHLLTGIR